MLSAEERRERRRAVDRRYYFRNKERHGKSMRAWRERNPEKVKAYNQKGHLKRVALDLKASADYRASRMKRTI